MGWIDGRELPRTIASFFSQLARRIESSWYSGDWLAYTLLPLSWFYCSVVEVRYWLYRHDVLKRVQLPVPIIVVGNITVGGTGKTPAVIWLAKLAQRLGYRVGIVTRGYRGTPANQSRWVTHDSDPAEVGDEAVLLARRTGLPVVVDSNRPRGASYLVSLGCQLIISDDGLQHYALRRDFEIALIDGARQLGNRFCLPAGPMRERAYRLSSVHLRITLGTEEGLGDYRAFLLGESAVNLLDPDRRISLSELQEEKDIHAIAGIAHPERFFQYLNHQGIQHTAHAFPDHHPFGVSDFDFPAKLVLMTEKDAVKCHSFARENYWYVPVEMRVDQGLETLLQNHLITLWRSYT